MLKVRRLCATGVDHLNVFDPKDPVQTSGGNSIVIGTGKQMPYTGEFGKAKRVYNTPNTTNIEVNNPQGMTGDFHNSHNRTNDWQKKVENINHKK
ncbi:hypothetical protein [Chryseobacterium sp.]|uniref:hypothetical protein n=1 Tax=Chryseobacterium sp. TaxID=1871047 RepID=UPI0012AAA6CF|nr:hypothetical protein [Chryseobacterium sp.]QFG53239.1 hypothetical protein F7R58_06655 [Chryseobacterium sp.]